jgi:hypothetical protein
VLDIISKASGGNLADQALQTYAALLERRLIVPSASQPYLAIDQHFFFDHFAPTLCHIYFDEAWYLIKYRDIREAVEKGMVASARHHYVRFGFYEHRLPYKIEIHEAWYLETNPDVKTAVEKGHIESGQAHFEAAGFREGRLPYPNFTLRTAIVDAAVASLQATISLPPAPAVPAPPPSSAVRIPSHAGHDTVSGLSLSAWTSMCNETESSHAAGRRFVWLVCAAAMVALGFGPSPGHASG